MRCVMMVVWGCNDQTKLHWRCACCTHTKDAQSTARVQACQAGSYALLPCDVSCCATLSCGVQFAMFHLGHPNILPVGDLGVRKVRTTLVTQHTLISHTSSWHLTLSTCGILSVYDQLPDASQGVIDTECKTGAAESLADVVVCAMLCPHPTSTRDWRTCAASSTCPALTRCMSSPQVCGPEQGGAASFSQERFEVTIC